MPGIFVTSSGTEIGKTFVTAALCTQLKAKGVAVDALKPVISDFSADKAAASDSGILLAALGRRVETSELDRISPWRYRAALAPNMAARLEGQTLDHEAIYRFCTDTLAGAPETLWFVEGAGGIMAPLTDEVLMIDWAQALDLPVLLVVGGYLGTISHSLTAAHVLQARGLSLAGIVVTDTTGRDLPAPLEDTAAEIARFLPGVPVEIAPFVEGPNPWQRARDLTRLVEGVTNKRERVA